MFHSYKPMGYFSIPILFWNLGHFTSISPGLNNVNLWYREIKRFASISRTISSDNNPHDEVCVNVLCKPS